MKKLLILSLLAFSLCAQAQVVPVTADKIKPSASAPSGACTANSIRVRDGILYTCKTDGSGWITYAAASSLANTALSNLASVSINAGLVPQTTLSLGAQATPWQYAYLYGGGTYGSHSFRLGGTPTGHRTVSFIDSDQVVAASASALTSTWLPYVTTGGLLTGSTNATLDSSGHLVAARIALGTAITSSPLTILGEMSQLGSAGVNAGLVMVPGGAATKQLRLYQTTDNFIIGANQVSNIFKIDLNAADGTFTINSSGLVQLGGATASFPALLRNATAIDFKLADNSAYAPIRAAGITGSELTLTSLALSATAPTVTSAGTSPSIPANNGAAAFTVNVGTGGTATTIVLAMPTAATGWICHATNITAAAANRADRAVRQTASTTTSVTLQLQSPVLGTAVAFAASDVVACQCVAY